MKKFYLIALFAFVCNFAFAQIEQVSYRGAFAPTGAMWTDNWTNWDPKNTDYTDAPTVVNVTADITVNTTWVVGRTYKLTGLIYVRNNATLTIQPGVVVKGISTTTGTALIVTKGAKLNAIGTASQPIIFTSNKTVAEGRNPGDWGGIVLLGKARFSATATSNTGTSNIEGITASLNTEYGGGSTPNDADNSGTLKYVRIEFGGYVFSNNNEINGLTMGAVGRGTTIDYVQTSFTNDDSFEWFGGAVNCKHLVAFRGVDDDFDADNGYKGAVQFALGIKDPGLADNPVVSTSEGFEVDNNPAGLTVQTGWDNTSGVFSNCTLIGSSGRTGVSVSAGHERPLRLRRGCQVKIYNSIFLDFRSNYLFVDGALTQTNATQTTPTLKFKSNIIAGVVNATYPAGVRGSSAVTSIAASELNTWFTTNNNTYTLGAGILTAPYNTANYNDYNANGTTIDYRPGTLASTGADFSDASIAAFLPQVGTGTLPVVANLTYCQGATGISPLTATLTSFAGDLETAPFTGVSLRWYTTLTTPVFTTTAPIPSTALAGTRIYYVAQVNSANFASTRVPLSVTINGRPGGVGAIKGTDALTAAVTAVGSSIGTSTSFTYSVYPPTLTATTPITDITGYLWTVPNGVNIVSGQGSNTLVVNYLNVPAGAGNVGTISAQGLNVGACPSIATNLLITKALAPAPTLKMYNRASTTPTTALTSFGQFAGTVTPIHLVSSAVTTATGYRWELPSVVTPVFGGVVPVTTTASFTAEPFLSPSLPSLTGDTTIPRGIAASSKFWTVTYNTYTGVNVNGVATNIVTSTAVQRIAGASAAPTLYTFAITSGSTAAVNDQFTYNGTTYAVRTALLATSSSLVCTFVSGTAAPSSSVAVPGGQLTKVSDSSTINFTIIARTSATTGYLASSAPYVQYGTVITSNLPSIIVNFAGATANTVNELYLGVKSLNGVGASVTNNNTLANATAIANDVPGINYKLYTEVVTPAIPTNVASPANGGINATSTYIAATPATTPSTARLLKVVSLRPLAPTSIRSLNGSVSVTTISTYVGTTSVLTLVAAPVANASSYIWNLPAGVTQLTGGTTNSITVNYEGVAPGTLSLVIGVRANNNIGSSTLERTLTLTAAVATVPASIRSLKGTVSTTNISTFIGTSTPLTLTTAVVLNALSYTFTVPAGVDIAEDGVDTTLTGTPTSFTTPLTTITVDYEGVASGLASIPVSVKANNFVGSSIDRTLNLTAAAPAAATTVSGTLAICSTLGTSVTYTIPTLAVGATSYIVTVPTLCTVDTVGSTATPTTTITIPAVANATFTVTYPSGFIANTTTSIRSITIQSKNGFGFNVTSRTLKLTNLLAVCPTAPKVAASSASVANGFKVIAYPNPSSSEFTIETSAKGAINVNVYDMQGRLVESTTSTQVGSRLAKGVYNVIVNQGANTKSVRVIKN